MARLTLAGRVRGLAVLVACAPAFVALAGVGVEGVYARVLEARVDAAAARLAGGEDPAAVAEGVGVRVRVLPGAAADGAGDGAADGAGAGGLALFVPGAGSTTGLQDARQAVGAGMFGAAAFPGFAEWDAAGAAPVPGCVVGLDRRLRVCAAEARLPDGRRAVADAIARRHVLFLADDPFAVLEVVLAGAALGLGLAAALGRRLLADVRALAARAAEAPSTPLRPIGIAEIDLLVDASNRRLATQARRAADLAHELKGPAAVLRVAAEALPADPRGERLRRSLDEAGRRVDAVATGFLALARAEAGLAAEARGPVDLLALARGLASTRPGVQVGAGAFVVRGVADALETALRNLVDNGLVAGDVHVVAEDGALVVWDTGPGVPDALRDRLFEPWVTGRAGGTGLGLSLARAVVEAHGGTLRLEGANRFVVRGLEPG